MFLSDIEEFLNQKVRPILYETNFHLNLMLKKSYGLVEEESLR